VKKTFFNKFPEIFVKIAINFRKFPGEISELTTLVTAAVAHVGLRYKIQVRSGSRGI